MTGDPKGWHEQAYRAYRNGRIVVLRPRPPSPTVEQEYLLDELNEVLFDLKEATLADDEARAFRYMTELGIILVEIRRSGLSDE